jgi:hypothetical protein
MPELKKDEQQPKEGYSFTRVKGTKGAEIVVALGSQVAKGHAEMARKREGAANARFSNEPPAGSSSDAPKT